MTARLLPLPDDLRFPQLIDAYPEFPPRYQYPRSVWLYRFEVMLREFYPEASSRDLSLTARYYAPFYLAAGHDVP